MFIFIKLYGVIVYVLSIVILMVIQLILPFPDKDQSLVQKGITSVIYLIFFAWLFIGAPIYTYLLASKRVTTEKNLAGSILAVNEDIKWYFTHFRIKMSFLPIIGHLFFKPRNENERQRTHCPDKAEPR